MHLIASLQRKLSRILKQRSLNWVLVKVLFIDEISMMDIKDFLMAQFNPDALNHPFGGLYVIFVEIFPI
jgi:DNA helicase TIP49 (TBP-interacting protein)